MQVFLLSVSLSLLSLLSLACSSGDNSAPEQGEPAAGESSGAEQGEPAAAAGESSGAEQGEPAAAAGEPSVAEQGEPAAATGESSGAEQGEPSVAEEEGLPAICTPSQLPDTAQRIGYADPCSADLADLYSERTECYLPQERPIDIRIEGTLPAYDRRVGAFFFPVAEEDSLLELSYSLPKQGSLYISSGSSGSSGSGAAEELVTEETRLNVGELDLEEQASCRILRASYSDGTEEKLALYLTSLPIVQLTVREPILHSVYNRDNIRRPGSFHLNDPYFRRRYRTGREVQSCAAFEGQGYTSAIEEFMFVPYKHSWRMELREGDAAGECSSEEERDIPLLGLYDDGDWILSSRRPGQARRDRISSDVSIDIMRFGHYHKEAKMAGGSRGHFVELFINDRLHGIYHLKEKINRQLLQVREDGFLERSYDPLPMVGIPSSFIYEDGASDQDFAEQAEGIFEMDNVVDLHILINLFGAWDNLRARNLYSGLYDQDSRIFFVLWDLDHTWEKWNLKMVTTEDERYTNTFAGHLLRRLVDTDAASFRSLLKARWEELRLGLITFERLIERFRTYGAILKQGGAAQRNQGRWSPPDDPLLFLDPELINTSHLDNMSTLIEERLELLDPYYAAIEQTED